MTSGTQPEGANDVVVKSASDILAGIAAALADRKDIDQDLVKILVSHVLIVAPAKACVQDAREAIISLAATRVSTNHGADSDV